MGINKFTRKQLLNTPIRELPLSLKDSWLSPLIDQLNAEIRQKNLKFKPHLWISDDWFSPDGTAGFAIPFYLIHPKLMKLEKEFLLEVEGGNRRWCLKLLRHETAHALDNAFYLRRKKKRQEIFGKSGIKYPESYTPNLSDRNFVKHLEDGYAQSHPEEDWAETFAVWLDPKSNWQRKYQDWGALKKLKCLDEIFRNLSNVKPLNSCKTEIDSFFDDKRTVEEYLVSKRKRLGLDNKIVNEKEIKELFSAGLFSSPINATTLVKQNRKAIGRRLSRSNQQYQSTISRAIEEVIQVCYNSNLEVGAVEGEEVLEKLTETLLPQIQSYQSSNRNRIIM